jgi:amino acid transporter
VVLVAAQSFAMVSPIMAVSLVSPLVARHALGATPMAIFVAGLAVFSLGVVVVEFSRRFPSGGLFHVWVGKTAGPAAGLFVGLLYLSCMIVVATGVCALVSHLTVTSMEHFAGGGHAHQQSVVPPEAAAAIEGAAALTTTSTASPANPPLLLLQLPGTSNSTHPIVPPPPPPPTPPSFPSSASVLPAPTSTPAASESHPLSNFPTWALAVAMQAVILVLSYFDVRWSVGGQLAVTVLSTAIVAGLSISILKQVSHQNHLDAATLYAQEQQQQRGDNGTTGILRSLLRVVPPLPAAGAYVVGGHATTAAAAAAGPSVSFVGFGSGLVYALSMFGGFEGAAVLGDEVVHPTKTIPRALALTIVVSTAFYFLASLAFRVGFKDPHEWAKDAAPLITMGGRWGSPTLVNILYISILFDGWAGCLACVTTASRLIARLARAGVFPCR